MVQEMVIDVEEDDRVVKAHYFISRNLDEGKQY